MNSPKIQTVNIKQKLLLFSDYWNPKIVGELNDHKVQVAKIKGKFIWHHHDNEDELFLVIKGQLIIRFRDKIVKINEGEFIIIPHPIEHMTEAKKETHIVLIEPKHTLNTGNVTNSKYSVRNQKKFKCDCILTRNR